MSEQNETEFDELNDEISSIFDEEVSESSDSDSLQAVEDLSLAQLIGTFFKQPRATSGAVVDVLRSEKNDASSRLLHIEPSEHSDGNTAQVWLQENQAQPGGIPRALLNLIVNAFTGSRLIGYSCAFIFVLIGNIIMAGDVTLRRSEEMQLAQGFPFLIFGFFIWLLTELVFSIPEIKIWWANRGTESNLISSESHYQTLALYKRIPIWRYVLALVAMILSGFTFTRTVNNTFVTPIFYIWLMSIACWSLVFAPLKFNIFEWASNTIDRIRAFHWKNHLAVILGLVIIIGVAGYFRFYDLADHPLEMTDDHVEKILDSGRVRDGDRNIFFANNGGREPMQMYLIALVSHLPGFGINHDTIKFVSSVESLLTIPALFWMAYALFEGEGKRRRLLIALIASALLAVSYWHVAITRQGLRIPLTPLVISLNLIYLMRGIRHNRRSDFIIAGLILGFGLYTYQALRMLPIVIVLAVFTAIVFNAKTMKERLKYVLNLSVLVAISFSVFVPLFRYSVDFPELFWRRTTGRLLGDSVIQEIQEDGSLLYRDASAQERFDAFVSNVPTIASNIRNVFLMFNWEGDVATISGVSTRPTMDIYSSALLVVGLAAWLAFALHRRDTVYWLVPLTAFLMLLPSALSIAFPGENPSHTRTSGAIPMIYLITAFPLVLLVEQILDKWQNWRGKWVSGIICVAIVGASFNANTYLYFEVYRQRYEESFHPYSDAGRYLLGYIFQGGSYGNAFLIGYEHWWSHRAIGLEGGLEEFWTGGIVPYTNGEYSTEPIIHMIYTNLDSPGTFRFEPDADLLFYYSPNDEDTHLALQELFPDGIASERLTYNPNETFMVYEVPALGTIALQEWILAHPPQ